MLNLRLSIFSICHFFGQIRKKHLYFWQFHAIWTTHRSFILKEALIHPDVNRTKVISYLSNSQTGFSGPHVVHKATVSPKQLTCNYIKKYFLFSTDNTENTQNPQRTVYPKVFQPTDLFVKRQKAKLADLHVDLCTSRNAYLIITDICKLCVCIRADSIYSCAMSLTQMDLYSFKWGQNLS